ncbi:hypothetical protein D3C86_1728420 [compost metagenome]
MLGATDHLAPGGRRIAPGPESGDHVAAHAFIGQQARGGTSARLGPFDVRQVRGFDQGPAIRGFQALGKQIEERVDRLIRYRGHRLECRLRPFDRDSRRLLVRHGNQQQFTAELLHQQVVTGLEARCQFGADHRDTVTGERDRGASNQTFERKRHESVTPCNGRLENV